MADVEFQDFSIQVGEALDDAVISYLYLAAGELETQTSRNSRQGKKYKDIEAKNLWMYKVDETAKSATVGSQHEAAYWEEFGTGEYALNGDGRKGWWVYIEGQDSSDREQKYYTKQEAMQTAAYLRSQGLDAHATNGIEPNRPLHRAFTSLKNKLRRMAEDVIGGGMK